MSGRDLRTLFALAIAAWCWVVIVAGLAVFVLSLLVGWWIGG